MFMEEYQGDELLGDTEEGIGVERDWLADTSKQWDAVKLSYGDGLDAEARTATFKKYDDYDNYPNPTTLTLSASHNVLSGLLLLNN